MAVCCRQRSQVQALRVVEQIMRTVQLRVQEPQVVWKALRLARKGDADFAACLIAQINLAAGCDMTASLDKAAVKTGGMKYI